MYPHRKEILPRRFAGTSQDEDSDTEILGLAVVKLTALIKLRDGGLALLRKGRRGMVNENGALHHDQWDTVLCEGIPVSLRELVSLVVSQLRLANNVNNMHKMLMCRWDLGWHVISRNSSGVTTHFWGGGVTQNTTTSLRRGTFTIYKRCNPQRILIVHTVYTHYIPTPYIHSI